LWGEILAEDNFVEFPLADFTPNYANFEIGHAINLANFNIQSTKQKFSFIKFLVSVTKISLQI